MKHLKRILGSKQKATALLPHTMTWSEVLIHVQNLPYGRNASRSDATLVLSEMKGTCSSKHALLKMIADENNIQDVELILGMYKMNQDNTPGIGDSLSVNGLEYVPEAHCYLKLGGERKDYTSEHSNIERIKSDILIEQEITPEQVADYKVQFHKRYLKTWIKESSLDLTFEEVWAIREACILSLSTNSLDS